MIPSRGLHHGPHHATATHELPSRSASHSASRSASRSKPPAQFTPLSPSLQSVPHLYAFTSPPSLHYSSFTPILLHHSNTPLSLQHSAFTLSFLGRVNHLLRFSPPCDAPPAAWQQHAEATRDLRRMLHVIQYVPTRDGYCGVRVCQHFYVALLTLRVQECG